MGVVTSYVRGLVSKQVEDNGIVVWFDPENHYSSVVDSLNIPGVTVAKYDGSFFALRHEIDHLMRHMEPPRLVVYVPMSEEASRYALIELTSAGVVLKPGQSPWQRNTRLAAITKRALEGVFSESDLELVIRQVDTGQISSVSELDRLAENRHSRGVVSVLFGSSDPKEIALAFVNQAEDSTLLSEIAEKRALGDITSFLQASFGRQIPSRHSVAEFQATFARYVLATEFVASLGDAVPDSIDSLPRAQEPAYVQACIDFVRAWRARSDALPSYLRWAEETELMLGVPGLELTVDQLSQTMTFRSAERGLQELVAEQTREAPTEVLVDLAVRRQSGFWAATDPEIQARWALIASAGRLMVEAARIEDALKGIRTRAATFVRNYVEGDQAWCLLDTYHRHLERYYQMLDLSTPDSLAEAVDLLVFRARKLYMRVGGRLAEEFVQALHEDSFEVHGCLRQSDVFGKAVSPALSEGKTAYILVDALRFETARELVMSLSEAFEVEFLPAIAAAPTITEIGMAALMPGTGYSPELISTEKGRIGIRAGEHVLKDRESRLRFLREQVQLNTALLRLGDMLPHPHKRVRDAIRGADLVVVTSQEIDGLGEMDSSMARQTMDQVPEQIQRVCRVLANLGVASIVISADHGYLFGDEITEDIKIDPPGGHTVDLHRRIWIGKGGSDSSSTVRVKVKDLGYVGDLELVAPRGFGVFKVPGSATAYFHGGFSLQELVVPVLTLRPKSQLSQPGNDMSWELVSSTRKISTRFFSIQILGQAGLFSSEVPRVRVELRVANQVISEPVSASYGFDETTGAVQVRMRTDNQKVLEPNTVTLMLKNSPSGKTASAHLLDASSGRELARIGQIPITISI